MSQVIAGQPGAAGGKEIRFNAFEMNTVSQSSHGLWSHPRSQAVDYTSLDYWVELAQLLERGKFDGLFLADVLGVYDVYGASPDAAVRAGAQIPINDPLIPLSAMAHATRDLGFVITSNTSYEPPFLFARRLSTLDHLTRGRIAWNVVTGFLESAARAMGRREQFPHDLRYDVADDYMTVVYKLLEGSWDDEAVLRDKVGRRFADPAHVRAARHDGKYYQVDAIHLSEPSPQRTPVLFQAGSSARGQRFAGEHAECIFVNGKSMAGIAEKVVALRAAAERAGRGPDALRIFTGMCVVVDKTEAAARAKLEDYQRYIDTEGELAHFSASTGIDFSKLDLDDPIPYQRNDANNSALEGVTLKSQEGAWTKRDVIERMRVGGRGPVIVGSPEQVADALEQWVDATGVDGFNLSRTVAHEGYRDLIDLVVPVLQARGRYKTAYREGTLREKLLGGSARLQSPHPAAGHRFTAG